MVATPKLKKQQEEFVRAYLGPARANAAKAARMAGYSESSAAGIGYNLLNRTQFSHVQEFLQAERGKLVERFNRDLPEFYESMLAIQRFDPAILVKAQANGLESLTKDELACLDLTLKTWSGGSALLAKPPNRVENRRLYLGYYKALSALKPDSNLSDSLRAREEIEGILNRLADDQDEADAQQSPDAWEEPAESSEDDHG
jgi:hypothetical protein